MVWKNVKQCYIVFLLSRRDYYSKKTVGFQFVTESIMILAILPFLFIVDLWINIKNHKWRCFEAKKTIGIEKNVPVFVEKDVDDPLIGMVFTFKENNKIPHFQDYHWLIGVPHGIPFTVEKKAGINDYWIIANGYGNLNMPNQYGSGKLCVNKDYLKI